MTTSARLFAINATAIAAAVVLGACSLMQLGGTVARKTGEAMTDYSKENDGAIAKLVGLGGQINTAVGSTVEDAARDGKDGESARTRPERPAGAPRTTPAARVDAAASASETDLAPAQPMSIVDAQRKLAEFGYRPGPADGAMGRRTIDALSRFQRENGLQVTGKLDAPTIDALRRAKRPA